MRTVLGGPGRIWADETCWGFLFCFSIRTERKGGKNGDRPGKRTTQALVVREQGAVSGIERFDFKGHRARRGAVPGLLAPGDCIVVSTLCCGRSNLGSNPSHGNRVWGV